MNLHITLHIFFRRELRQESVKMFQTNHRLINKTKKSQFLRKLSLQRDMYSQIVHEKIVLNFKEYLDKILKLAQQIKLKEIEIKSLIISNTNNKMIQILKEQIKSDIKDQVRIMLIMCNATQYQLEVTRSPLENNKPGSVIVI